jgi:hypothetical protein
LGYPAIWYLNEGHRTGRLERSAHPALTPCELYRKSEAGFTSCAPRKNSGPYCVNSWS